MMEDNNNKKNNNNSYRSNCPSHRPREYNSTRSYPPTRGGGGHYAGRHSGGRGGRSSGFRRGRGRWEARGGSHGRGGGRGRGRGGYDYGGRFSHSYASQSQHPIDGVSSSGSAAGEGVGTSNQSANFHPRSSASSVGDGDDVMSMKSGSTGGGGGDAISESNEGNNSMSGNRRGFPANRDHRGNNSNSNWHSRARSSFEQNSRHHFNSHSGNNADNNRGISFRPKQSDYGSRGSQDLDGSIRDSVSLSTLLNNRNDGNGKPFYAKNRPRHDGPPGAGSQRFMRRRSHSPPQRSENVSSGGRGDLGIQPSFKRPRFVQNDRDSSSECRDNNPHQGSPSVSQRFVQRGRQIENDRSNSQSKVSSQNDSSQYSASKSSVDNTISKPQSASMFSSFLSMAASSSPFVNANNDINRNTDTADPMQTYLRKRSAATSTTSISAIDSNQNKSTQATIKPLVMDARSPSPEAIQAPSSTVAWARMLDLCAQMEFAHAKYCIAVNKVEAVQNKIKVLERQPTGEASYMTDLKALEDATGIYDEIIS